MAALIIHGGTNWTVHLTSVVHVDPNQANIKLILYLYGRLKAFLTSEKSYCICFSRHLNQIVTV